MGSIWMFMIRGPKFSSTMHKKSLPPKFGIFFWCLLMYDMILLQNFNTIYKFTVHTYCILSHPLLLPLTQNYQFEMVKHGDGLWTGFKWLSSNYFSFYVKIYGSIIMSLLLLWWSYIIFLYVTYLKLFKF